VLVLAACANGCRPRSYPVVGRVTAFDPSFGAMVASDARIEKIADGITWAEGPAWVRKGRLPAVHRRAEEPESIAGR